MRALLLVALLDEKHTHNAAAETWLADNIHHGWASCPLTQNGCVRILSQPAYPNALSVADAVMRLRTATSEPCSLRMCIFWPWLLSTAVAS